jgi:hypothetical protein
MAHRTVRCTPDMSGAPATSPKAIGFDRWSSVFWARLDVGGAPDMHCRVSGAPVWACLTSARAARAFNALQVAVGAEVAVAPQLHRTVRCTPDSPVNFSGAAEVNSRGWRVPEATFPWSTGHVRCTPDSPVNYSGVASGNFPKVSSSELESSGAPDMSGGTPDSPVRQTRGAFG